ncbi:glycosyltransferase family 4 protein [Butyrivibrio fibrisolvens]|uniref:glycosyltransferase family 4 protein n=1 Tax=Butyrivibrio fibrisolvens TaxID=831 RepID=UPI0020C17C12|nr:glycosyltransferase [Butyrivibrio fibrisolvens]
MGYHRDFKISQKYNLTIGNNDNCDIIICGFVSEEEKLRLIEKSKALLFPSIREGWGIIVSEAAARGTPSIVYNSPGARDAVDFGNAGYMCDSNNPSDLAKLMLDTIENANRYTDIQHKALAYVKRFSWNHNRDEIVQMICRLSSD